MNLLDTAAVTELRLVKSGRADPNVARWARHVLTTYLSIMPVQVLERRVLLREQQDERRGRALRTWLEGQVLPAFDGLLLPFARRDAALDLNGTAPSGEPCSLRPRSCMT